VTFESNRAANHTTFIAIRLAKSAVATSHRQKIDNDDEEKFDCDEHAHRFDLIRSSQAMALLRVLSLRV
jgi:hypothetical protein